MFTGLIEEIGTVTRFQRIGERFDLDIQATKVMEGLKVDDSISINGVCLTVVGFHKSGFSAQVVPQTVKKSNLGSLETGARVNLERAMAAGDRFGGHFVQGHVDGVGRILQLTHTNDHAVLRVKIPEDLTPFCVDQGSIALNGISLTIASIRDEIVEVAIIPHTLQETNLKNRQSGDDVNIEVDMLSKYVHKHLQSTSNSGITLEWMKEQGF